MKKRILLIVSALLGLALIMAIVAAMLGRGFADAAASWASAVIVLVCIFSGIIAGMSKHK